MLSTQTALAQLSESEFTSYLKDQDFSGSVLVKNSEGEVFQLTQGTSDQAETTPIDENARFRIASITKLFTAVIIMQLVDEEKVALDDKLSKFMNTKGITYANEITVKDLLQHTSGLKKESNVSYLKGYSPDELIQRFATKKADLPGEKHFYNNVDFLLLGRIIEEVTQSSFEENLKTRVLEPLGMKDSGLITTQDLPEGVVGAYRTKAGKRKEELKIHVENFWAAGSMYSTAADLLRFAEGIKAGKLVSDAAKEAMFTSSASLGYAALGCWTFNSPFIEGMPRIMERRGEIMGSTSVLMTNLDGPETIIVLSNTDEFRPETFGQQDNLKEYLFSKLFD